MRLLMLWKIRTPDLSASVKAALSIFKQLNSLPMKRSGRLNRIEKGFLLVYQYL